MQRRFEKEIRYTGYEIRPKRKTYTGDSFFLTWIFRLRGIFEHFWIVATKSVFPLWNDVLQTATTCAGVDISVRFQRDARI